MLPRAMPSRKTNKMPPMVLVLAVACFMALVTDAAWLPRLNTARQSRTAQRLERYLLKEGKTKYGSSSPPKIDLVFVLDGSDSVRNASFRQSIRSIKYTLRYFSISPSTTRVAMVTFSSTATTVFGLNRYNNRECTLQGIDRARYSAEGSALGTALQNVNHIFNRTNSRNGAKRIVVIISDGYWNHGVWPSTVAAITKQQYNAKIFVVGIGYSKNTLELRRIASFPRYKHLYLVKKASSFQRIVRLCTHLDTYTECKIHGAVVYDECERRCKCHYGKLINCCRVRKEVTSMSLSERSRYLTTYKKLTTEQPYKAKYDAFIAIHENIFFGFGIHEDHQFLPWHRWYVLELENLLREIDCRVTVPYWAWSLWAHDPWSVSHIWNNASHGLGGNGATNGPPCVTTGQFSQAQGNWSLPNGDCLMREFFGFPPDQVAVSMALTMTQFADFELTLRASLHDTVHCLIGGTMCQLSSASAPEFFLHHGYVDKIWNDWQQKSEANKNAFFPLIPGPMAETPYERKELIDIKKQPGCVSVCYDEPTSNNATSIITTLNAASRQYLSNIPRLRTSAMPVRARQLFKLNDRELLRCQQLEVIIRGREMDTTQMRLHGYEATLGFHLDADSTSTNQVQPLSRSDSDSTNFIGGTSNTIDADSDDGDEEENENEFEENMDDVRGDQF